MLDRHNKNMQLQIAIIEKLSLKPTKLDLKSTFHIFHPLKLVWQNNTCSYRHKCPHHKQFKIIYVWTFRGCLVDKLQYMFSIFKQHYTHFYTFSLTYFHTCFQTYVPNTPLAIWIFTEYILMITKRGWCLSQFLSLKVNVLQRNTVITQ